MYPLIDQFLRVPYTIEPGRSLLQFVTTNCLKKKIFHGELSENNFSAGIFPQGEFFGRIFLGRNFYGGGFFIGMDFSAERRGISLNFFSFQFEATRNG